MQLSLDEFALSYCYSRLIIRPELGSGASFSVHSPTFLTCMKAIGMASYNSVARSAVVALEAQNFYNDAIRATNDALSSSASVQDYTLLSVIALASLEGIVGHDARSLDVWKRHVGGIAALLTLRGDEQLETSDGRHLFLTAMGSLAAKCLILGMRLPAKVTDLMDTATRQYGSDEDPLWRICLNMTHLVNLYSDVILGTLTDPHTILMRATQIDKNLAASFNHAPRAWQHEIRTFPQAQLDTLDPSLPKTYHVYLHVLAAQQWNVMRGGRIICNTLIKSAAAQLPEERETDHILSQQCSTIIQQMQTNILATVAQYVGMTGDKYANMISRQCGDAVGVHIPPAPTILLKTANIERVDLPSLRLSHAHNLLWSVGLVGRAVVVEDPIRTTVCKVLRLIGQKLGISQAFAVAATLETDRMHSGRSCTLL